MKNDKHFEHLVAIIEKSISNEPNITVQHDVQLIDKDGLERQIDVLIEIDLGKRFGVHKIIVECKHWNSTIEVGLMGSFVDLVNSVGAFKGIFVSKKGFQRGAIIKAQNNEKIVLRTLKEITQSEIASWIKPEKITKWYFTLDPTHFQLTLNATPKISPKNSTLPSDYEIQFEELNYRKPLYIYCAEITKSELSIEGVNILKDFFKTNPNPTSPLKGRIRVFKEFNPNKAEIILKDKKHQLHKVDVTMGVILNSEIPSNTTHKKYVGDNNNVEAEIMTFEFANDKINYVQTSPDQKPDIYFVKNESKLNVKKFNVLGNINDEK